MKEFIEELKLLIKCQVPVIEIVTYEWQRIQSILNDFYSRDGIPWKRWNQAIGISDADGNIENITDPIAVLKQFLKDDDSYILILENFNLYMDNPMVQNILFEICKYKGNKTLIIETAEMNLPNTLTKEIPVLYMPLPDKEFIKKIAESVIVNNDLETCDFSLTEEVINSALGLTTSEAYLAFDKAVKKFKRLDNTVISYLISEKEDIIRKEGQLEYYHPEGDLSEIGGLENLKDWLVKREQAFTEKAEDFGIETPKGVLLLGLPGCGKSLTAKCIAKAWNYPLLRFDLGKVFGGIVGQSEGNMRKALDIAKTIAPCVLWIDEIEKGLSGLYSSNRTDGGTSARVFGTFLTWMQEKKEPVFVVATANNIEQLPPELLRKGRFDEIFFVDLPSEEERQKIFEIHINKKGRQVNGFNLNKLTKLTRGFTGAEIKNIVDDGLFNAFYKNRDITTDDLIKSINDTTPLSSTRTESILDMREWANKRARLASVPNKEPLESEGKSIPRLKSEVYNPFITKKDRG